jgi:hypothetical protein
MDLPFFTVSTPHQAYELGLNNDSFRGENAHDSTVAPKKRSATSGGYTIRVITV